MKIVLDVDKKVAGFVYRALMDAAYKHADGREAYEENACSIRGNDKYSVQIRDYCIRRMWEEKTYADVLEDLAYAVKEQAEG